MISETPQSIGRLSNCTVFYCLAVKPVRRLHCHIAADFRILHELLLFIPLYLTWRLGDITYKHDSLAASILISLGSLVLLWVSLTLCYRGVFMPISGWVRNVMGVWARLINWRSSSSVLTKSSDALRTTSRYPKRSIDIDIPQWLNIKILWQRIPENPLEQLDPASKPFA